MRITLNTFFWIVVGVFFSAASFYTYSVIAFKNSLNISAPKLALDSGQIVNVVKIIDGDEISVKYDDKQFIVRILGMKSFDPSVNDPYLQNIAKNSFNFLEKNLLSKNIRLLFDRFKQDSKNRFLSYVHRDNQDMGLIMIQKGISLVYSRYPFSRMQAYDSAEAAAKKNQNGLWGYPRVVKRSLQLREMWDKQRSEMGTQ